MDQDLVQLVDPLDRKGAAAADPCQSAEQLTNPLDVTPPPHRDDVYGRPTRANPLLDRLDSGEAVPVCTITEQHDDSGRLLVTVQVERRREGVEQRRTTERRRQGIDCLQEHGAVPFLTGQDIGSIIKRDEAQNGRFRQLPDEVPCGELQRTHRGCHARAEIDRQHEIERDSRCFEESRCLLDVVFEEHEVVQRKIVDETTAPVLHHPPAPVSGRRRRAPRALASVRRSNGTCSFPAYRFHEDVLAW